MKAYNCIFRSVYLMTIAFVLLSSCKSNSSEREGLVANQELVSAIGKYVTCPTDSVQMMLASSDSIIQLVDTCSLEYLDLYIEGTNSYLDSLYSKEIPTILKLYGTYDAVTNFPTSEANAAFTWHEVANVLIAEYFGKEQADTDDVETLFKVIDDILDSYNAGTQYDMNVSAWRWVMLSDYRLINAYKALYDSCNEPSILKSVQDSYINLLEMYRNRCEQIEGHWSDLPRELACMQMHMMDERREFIEKLNSQYKMGLLSLQSLKQELDKRTKDVDWDISDYILAEEELDTLNFPADEIQMDPQDVSYVASDDAKIKIYTWNPNPNHFYGYDILCQIQDRNGKPKTIDFPFDLDGGTVNKIHTLKKNDGSTYYLLELYYRNGGMCESELVAVRLVNDKLVPVKISDGGKISNEQTRMSVEYDVHWNLGVDWEWIYEFDKKTKTLYSPTTAKVKYKDEYVYSGIADRYDEYHFNGEQLVLVKKNQPNRRLHKSLAEYAYLAEPFHTNDFNIRIDGMIDGTFRYAAWKKGNPMFTKPEIVIYNGKRNDDYSYCFTNDGYEYIVNKAIPNKNDSSVHEYLLVKKDGKVLLKEEINLY